MAIKENQVVTIEYELKELGDSNILDSNIGQAPLEFTTGMSDIIPDLEKQLISLSVGDKADIIVKAGDGAYGLHNPEAFDDVPRKQFANLDLKVGLSLLGEEKNGEEIQVIINSFNDKTVTIDYNHPLAGKDLIYSVTILDVRDKK